MTRRVPGRIHQPNAGHHFRLAFDQPEILQLGKRPECGRRGIARFGAAFPTRPVRSPLVLVALTIRLGHWIVGCIGALLHQTERYGRDGKASISTVDLGGIDAGALQIVGQA